MVRLALGGEHRGVQEIVGIVCSVGCHKLGWLSEQFQTLQIAS